MFMLLISEVIKPKFFYAIKVRYHNSLFKIYPSPVACSYISLHMNLFQMFKYLRVAIFLFCFSFMIQFLFCFYH